VRTLTARGAAVCINYATRAAEAEAAADEIAATGGRVIAVRADVADVDTVARMVARTESELGPVRILVNNAGTSSPATLESYDPAAMARMRQVNVDGVINTIRAVTPGMKERGYGRIINIASNAAIGTALPGTTFYAATKGEVLILTRRFGDGAGAPGSHGQRGGAGVDRDGDGASRAQRAGIPGASAQYERAHHGRADGTAGRYRQCGGFPGIAGIGVCDSAGPHY
jgi:NAD(P)-dependent dehydrogenase (short-subunit alcohol dehydrogenase family)